MKPVQTLSVLASAILLVSCTTTAELPVAAPEPIAAEPPSASLQDLVAQVEIPYEVFTLDNGLTTIVHTDRKAPIVGVTVYYRVGSRHEPRGRTGFAHLFEHIMFNGSENVENFDIPLEAAGSTTTNGSTWYDRTNYVETVPTGALDLALMMESDRMGYLLGALTQESLDRQRGVVQNEKRQGDNQPYGLAEYLVADNMLPVGHPYRHNTIGSMADLSAASLEDVRSWFRDNYAPNNVVLALAGDIDAETAKEKVERWFGAIPRGPEVAAAEGGPVTLPAPVTEEITDQVSQVRVSRNWTGPGINHPDAVPLEVGMHILGGLASSRLDNAMVYGEQVATRVSAYSYILEGLSFLSAEFDLAPEADREETQALFDAEIDRMVNDGPTENEVKRAATQIISGQLTGLERVGGMSGKGAELVEGLLYTGNPEHYRVRLQRIASLTPQEIRDAMQRWLRRPAYTLATVPGERELDGALMGGWGDEDINPPPPPDTGGGITAERTGPERDYPPVGDVPALDFPDAERAQLANGIGVTLVRRDSVPTVNITLLLDAGKVVDSPEQAGLHSMMVDMMSEGTLTRGPLDIVIEQEELGATISTVAGVDADQVGLTSLITNLPQSLDLMADITLRPAFTQEAFDRVQAQRLAGIEEERTSPGALAGRAFGRVLFGTENPYALAATTGEYDVIAALTPADLRAEHARWFRPDLASFIAVGDISMEELLPQLEAAFGRWRGVRSAPPQKHNDMPIPAPRSRLVVVDRPNSPQSVLLLGRVLPIRGTDQGNEPLQLANEVLGNGFLSRLMSDLRETKGWTYSISSGLPGRVGPVPLAISTAVQSDRTADSIRVILEQMEAFPSENPVTDVEYQRVTDGNIRGLPNRFETNGQVMGALLGNVLYQRPDDYQERLPEIYRAITPREIDAAAAEYLHPRDLAIVVVGDRAQIDEQLATLGMDIEYMEASEL
jgi:predicted Zn-dependent peptidase